MPDYYHAPALVLIALLLPAFGYLYLRYRDTRTLLWFLGFLFALGAMVLMYTEGPAGFSGKAYPWMAAAGETCTQLSSALFLGSLSPRSFRVGRFRILHVATYTLPLVIYSILLYGVFHAATPRGPAYLVFPALCILSAAAAIFWATDRCILPVWLAVLCFLAFGGLTCWAYLGLGASAGLDTIECGNLFVTALLILFAVRRFSPGVVLSALGFAGWSLGGLETIPSIRLDPVTDIHLIYVIVMAKVVAAMGMILLALEDELCANKSAQARECRARRELEAYANLVLSRRQLEDFDRQGDEICRTVTGFSRFSQAALLFESGRRYRVAGSAGLDAATIHALDDLAARIPVAGFLVPGSVSLAVESCRTFRLDLVPWLRPGDDLKRLRFTSALAVPMPSRTGAVEGALLLAGMRSLQPGSAAPALSAAECPPAAANEPLRADDLLPIELLTARLQAARSQTMMFEKLIDSEKFAGLGQLAGNVTQQLNNPLTVILGYASLLEESAALNPNERKGVESILGEARRMKCTLESLSRVARPRGDDFAAVSVTELLSDMEELHRADFLRRSIEFRLNIAPGLPRVLCSAQQLRQAVLHCLHFASEAIESQDASHNAAEAAGQSRTIRLEATSEGAMVQILVAHSGAAFPNPDRAFDSHAPTQASGDTAALGLSLCATIMRDNNGRASAVNLDPRGAAILLELRAA